MTNLNGDAQSITATFADGSQIRARQVVLATGVAALGGPATPKILADIPRSLWATTSQAIDFAALEGQARRGVGCCLIRV